MSKSAVEPVLAVTPGEPAGIGPDLVLSLSPEQYAATLVVIADPRVLKDRAEQLSLPIKFNVITQVSDAKSGQLNVLPIETAERVVAGVLNPANAAYVLDTLEAAVALCESGDCSAMVTGPVHKSVINEAGIAFSGHTEWLANRTSTKRVVMMLATSSLRVALATTHLPLRDVADAINFEDLLLTLNIIHEDLQNKYQIQNPRILVCGLNPHAGESGVLGQEEINIIEPVIREAQARGINALGPVPADTAFTPGSLKTADVVLAMYHDQGLPVLKHQGFGEAINITLGLPITRTSVDHGTALDLAGKGTADTGSLHSAISQAIALVAK